MSVPSIDWRPDGTAYEREFSFKECPDKDNPMRGVDGYGPIAWTCPHCRGHGSHQSVTVIVQVRRPEYDAPRPGSLE